MSAVPVAAPRRPGRLSAGRAAGLVALLNALVVLAVRPGVGDMWAALARADAVRHGVGTQYWFAWFAGGTTPGSYSLLTPWLSSLVGAYVVVAVATLALTPLTEWAVRGTTHADAAVWVATAVAALNLWSGRVPYAAGCAAAVAAVGALRSGRRWIAVSSGVLATLFSPLAGAFLALGLVGTALVRSRERRNAVAVMCGPLVVLAAAAWWFGSPGPQPFDVVAMIVSAGLTLAMLIARPHRQVAYVVAVTALLCPVAALVPNALGANLIRLIYTGLPVAVLATARVRRRMVAAVALLPLVWSALATYDDLRIASAPMSSTAYYAPLIDHLDATAGLDAYRVEVVPDGTHTAAYALLGHVALARGYETQSDNRLNTVVNAPVVTSTAYRRWLDDNAVGYVALDRHTLSRDGEYGLVAGHPPRYLQRSWGTADWVVFRVLGARPILSAPARMIDQDQANMRFDVPSAATIAIRVRWSEGLRVRGPRGEVPGADLDPDGLGWTLLTVRTPGVYTLAAV